MHSLRAISSRDDTMDPHSHVTSYVVSSSLLLQGAQTYVWVHLKRQYPAVVQEPGYSACFWPSQVICALYLAPPSTKPCDSGSQQTSTIGALDYAYIVRDDRILCELGGLSFPRIVQLPLPNQERILVESSELSLIFHCVWRLRSRTSPIVQPSREGTSCTSSLVAISSQGCWAGCRTLTAVGIYDFSRPHIRKYTP